MFKYIFIFLLCAITSYAAKPDIFVSTGHSMQVSFAIVNPAETVLVTTSDNYGTGIGMKIWDIKTGKEIKTVDMSYFRPTSMYFLDDKRFMYISYKSAYIFSTLGEKLEEIKFPKESFFVDYINKSRDFAFKYNFSSVTIYSMRDGSEISIPEFNVLKKKYFSLNVQNLGYGYFGLFYKPTYDDPGGIYIIYNENLDIVKKGRLNGDFSIYEKYICVTPDLKYVSYQDLSATTEDNTIFVASLESGNTVNKVIPRPLIQKIEKKNDFFGGTLGGDETLHFNFLPDGRLLLEYVYDYVGLKGSDNELDFITLMRNGLYSEQKFKLTGYMKLSTTNEKPYAIGKSSTIYAGYQDGRLKAIDTISGKTIREFGVKPLNFYYATAVDGKIINIHEDNDFDAGTKTYRYNIWDMNNLKLEKYNISNTGKLMEVYKRLSYMQGKMKVLVNPDDYYSAIPSMFFKPDYKNDESYGMNSQYAFINFKSGSPYAFKNGQQSISLYDKETQKQLRASFYAFADGEWVIMTPDGYYTASEGGEQYINVRIDNVVYPLGNYRETFYRPDLVKLAIEGRALEGMKNMADIGKPPIISITNTQSKTEKASVDITIKVTDTGGGIGTIRLFINGTGVMTENARSLKIVQNSKELVKTYNIKLPTGENVIKAVAFDGEDNVQSNSAEMTIVSTFSAAKKPNLYALAVGINQYRNPKLNLKYAAADAELFASTLKNVAGTLFAKTEITLLTTQEQTTKESIIRALDSFRSMNPDDIFVFFVASHGTVDEGEYFLITSNVGALSTVRLKQDALTQAQLKEYIANIPSTKKLVLIDTCNAGKLGEELSVAMMTRGMNEDTAMKILSRAVGSTVISASTSYQEALEGYEGHGLFTKTFADGLGGKADADKDGYIKTNELANYIEETVPDLAQKFFNRPQFPTINTAGQSFPVGRY